MMKRLTNMTTGQFTGALGVEDARRLSELLDERGEWFLRERREGARPELKQGAQSELRRGEWDVRVSSGALIFSYWGEAGASVWRIKSWRRDGERLLLDAARRGARRGRDSNSSRARESRRRARPWQAHGARSVNDSPRSSRNFRARRLSTRD